LLTLAVLLACTPPLPATGDSGALTGTGLVDTHDTVRPDSGDSGPTCTLFRDEDGDGWGDETQTTTACDASGYTDQAGDCHDQDAAIHPDAPEVCNTLDDDCDLAVDEGEVAPATWFQDLDLDGYGTATATVASCEQPEGFAKSDDDCDDGDDGVHPYADETCDDVDQDCDAVVDESAVDASTWHPDLDGDGYGDAAAPTLACQAPSLHVLDDTDCDDTSAAVHPGAAETCDDLDQDCDATIDEDPTDPTPWYDDGDGDGHGDPGAVTDACDAPSGTVEDAGDCDDGDGSVHPGAAETCDDVDQDCDGTVDEDASDAAVFYADTDGDGHGDPGATTAACEAPEGTVEADDDCDDGDGDVHPGAAETCDDVDQDCDGSVDEDPTDPTPWHADADGDGHGDPSTGTDACEAPSGHVADDTDCDDTLAGVSPSASETCDDVDQDCDGTVDEDASDRTRFYADTDGDGFGDASSAVLACEAPTAHVADDTDCDDGAADTWPGAPESCDSTDQDCDGTVDEDATDATTWYVDADADGYGDPDNTLESCNLRAGHAASSTDCDDGDAAVNPGASETCDDVDQDCDGTIDEDATDRTRYYLDDDGDGHGDKSTNTLACEAPTSYVDSDDDCDDTDPTISPSAAEVCDSTDQDCDGHVDEGTETDWFEDDDGDGYGDPATGTSACSAPSSLYVSNDDDCYDGNSDASPDQTDWFDTDRGDGSFDYDCDGHETQEETDFGSCDYDSSGNCAGTAGWYAYYGWADIPDCGDGWYWEEDCEEDEYWGYYYCEMTEYDWRDQACR